MKIGIIGAGHIGSTLARKLTRLGHTVSVANSRGPASLAALAAQTGAKPVSVTDAVKGVDLAGAKGRIALPVAGDDRRAKAVVIDLIEALGFEGIDGGSLDESWRQQPGTPVYCTDLDVDGVRRGLSEADRARAPELRELVVAKRQQLPPGSTPRDRVLLGRSVQLASRP
jgi:predicted dinucleotide-binding enzyme